MKKIRYVCSHCGRKFESEKTENLECPGCFWSTTVHPEGEKTSNHVQDDIYTPPNFKEKSNKKLLFVIIAVGLLAGITVAVWMFGGKTAKKDPAKRKINITAPSDINKSKKINNSLPPEKEAPVISTANKHILEEELSLPEEHVLTGKENEILLNHADYSTGMIEKLPSQIWDVEQYKKLIEDQEKAYKVPLPRSYKKKLIQHFKENYLASSEPFEQGDWYKAREAWISGLIFPIYDNNIQKHRGVVLTMLKPYINDTLSKIGVSNQILVERSIRYKEEELSQGYEEVVEHIKKEEWGAALRLLKI